MSLGQHASNRLMALIVGQDGDQLKTSGELVGVKPLSPVDRALKRLERREFWSFFAACAAVWTLYLLAFWPALMSNDSVDQWRQLEHGRFIDQHPAIHTILNWLITRPWRSPSAVALFDELVMAAAVAWGLVELGRWGVPRWSRAVALAVLLFSPAMGLTVITLWKDVPFTIATTLLAGMMLALARTDGEWLRARSAQVALGGALAAAALLRQNGPGVLVALSLVLLLWPWGTLFRKRVAVALATSLALVFAVKGPLYALLHVQKMSAAFAMQSQFHQLAAFAAAGELGDADRAYFAQAEPVALWQRDYRCETAVPLLYSGTFKGSVLAQHPEDVFGRLWELVKRHPSTFLRHEICVTSLIWRLAYPHAFLGPRGFVSNTAVGAPETSPLLKGLHRLLVRLFRATERPGLNWLVWRPALWLYVLLLFTALSAWRRRCPAVLLFALPALANSATLALAANSQDFRYQFPIYVIGIFAPLLVFGCWRGDEQLLRPPGQASLEQALAVDAVPLNPGD